jgi:hypothetical protein
VPDILTQGEGRSSGPWPRRVAVAAALVLVAVLVVHYLPRSRHETRRPARAAVTAAPVPPGVTGAASGDAGVAREVSIAGRPLGARLTLPAGYLIKQGTSRGLLLAPAGPRAGTTADKLWDPAAPQASRVFDGVIAVSATQIAWVPPCAARCRIQVLNLTTGAQTPAELPAASSVASAAFSPDGRLLVVQVGFSDNTANGARAVQLEQVSLASGHLTAVPQTWVSSDTLVGFGWAAGSDSLVAEFSFTTRRQLASWRPGASRLAIVAFRPQRSPAALVIGQDVP